MLALPDLTASPVDFAQRRARAEFDLVSAIYADPGPGVAVAEGEGVRQHDFAQPDLRLLFLAAEVARHWPKVRVLKFARLVLRREHYWDNQQIRGNLGAMTWSDQSLAAFACSWPPGRVAIVWAARRLRDLVNRELEARLCLARAAGLLNGAIAPSISLTKQEVA